MQKQLIALSALLIHTLVQCMEQNVNFTFKQSEVNESEELSKEQLANLTHALSHPISEPLQEASQRLELQEQVMPTECDTHSKGVTFNFSQTTLSDNNNVITEEPTYIFDGRKMTESEYVNTVLKYTIQNTENDLKISRIHLELQQLEETKERITHLQGDIQYHNINQQNISNEKSTTFNPKDEVEEDIHAEPTFDANKEYDELLALTIKEFKTLQFNTNAPIDKEAQQAVITRSQDKIEHYINNRITNLHVSPAEFSKQILWAIRNIGIFDYEYQEPYIAVIGAMLSLQFVCGFMPTNQDYYRMPYDESQSVFFEIFQSLCEEVSYNHLPK